MAAEPTNARNSFGDLAPALAEITDKVLFGNVWQRGELSPRDRSLVTVTTLVSTYRINELPFHISKALENGVSPRRAGRDHHAHRLGWPAAMTALSIARKVFDEVASENGTRHPQPGKSAPKVVASQVSKSVFKVSSFLRASSSAILPSNRRSGGVGDNAASMMACAPRTGSPA